MSGFLNKFKKMDSKVSEKLGISLSFKGTVIFILLFGLIVILYLFGGLHIASERDNFSVVSFANSVCGNEEVEHIRIWSREFVTGSKPLPLGYSFGCKEPTYGIKSTHFFYLVPSWVVQDENGNLIQEKTIMWGE